MKNGMSMTLFTCDESIYSQKEMVCESTERNLKLDWAFTLSRLEGVAINEHFLLKAYFSTLRGEACASTQYGWPLICKIPKKGAIESSYFYFPAWIIWYSANFISFNHNSILILALRPYVIQGRNALVMEWVSHAELQSFNTMRVITRAHYYAFRRDFTD